MKKLMIALSAATLVVLGAKAADPVTLGAIEGFEGRPVAALDVTMTDDNNAEGAKYWSRADGKTGDSVVAAYETAPAVGNNKYLKVDETDVLTRGIGDAESIPANGGNITISTKVQFTAADEAPVPDTGDKLLVWAKAPTDGDTDQNIYICITDGTATEENPYIVTDKAVVADEWYNLKIVAKVGGTELEPVTVFDVIVGNDTIATGCKSMVTTGDATTSISSIGFKGTGAVDDIGFTSEEGYQPADITVTVAGNALDYGVQFGDDEYTRPVAMKAGDKVTLVVFANETDTVESTKGTPAWDVDANAWKIEYPLTNEDAGEEGALTITITVTPAAPESGFTPAQQIVVGNMSGYYQSGKTDADAGCYATVGTIANGVDFTVTVGGTAVAADATFDVSVGNNVMMKTKYFVVEEGTVKVANVILAVEDVTLKVGENIYELSKSPNDKLTKGAVAFTGGKSTADATTDGYLLTVDSSHDILALNFANQTKDTFYITKKTYCWGAAYENQMAVSYGITPADNDNGALWLYPVGWTEDGSVPNYYFGEGMYLDYMIAVGNASAQVRLTYAKPGPQEWSDVTDDNLDKVVELPTGSTVGADAVKQWANDNSVKFEAGVKIPVNALIFNVAPIDAPKEETEKAAADTVLAEVIAEAAKAKVDLEALLKQAAGAGADGLTVTSLATKYPMAVIKLVPATVIESSDNAKFFQLSITLK